MRESAIPTRTLSGVRVLDLGQHEAGSTCGQMLGWLGADVIKIEAPKTGDPGRRIGSPLQTQEPDPSGKDAWYFLMHNSNKRSVTLNLKDPRGKAILLGLAKSADVLVENMAPGALERLGLGADVLQAAHPALIVARIKAFGLSGPYSEYKAFDPISQAVGGILSLTGPMGGEPTRVGPSAADSTSGLVCAAGILAALVQRNATKVGQQVEVSMQEAVLTLIRGRISDFYNTEPHETPRRVGNELVRGVPSGVFPCKGGGPNDYVYVVSSLVGVDMWARLLVLMGRTDLAGDERYATEKARIANRDEVNAIFRAWTTTLTKYEVMERMNEDGLLCGAVLDIADLLTDRHLVARGAIHEYEHPTRGTVRMPGPPVRLSASSGATRRPPVLGEHTDEVLGDVLGFDAARLAELRAEGVV